MKSLGKEIRGITKKNPQPTVPESKNYSGKRYFQGWRAHTASNRARENADC